MNVTMTMDEFEALKTEAALAEPGEHRAIAELAVRFITAHGLDELFLAAISEEVGPDTIGWVIDLLEEDGVTCVL